MVFSVATGSEPCESQTCMDRFDSAFSVLCVMVCSSDRAWKCQLHFTGAKGLAEGSIIGLPSFGTDLLT
jgi:hypothetical protein